MKKIKKILFIIVIMMFVSIINVDAASVSIKSVKLVDKADSVTELSEAKVDGFNINFDLEFSKIGDSANYEVILNNPTNHEYEINTEKTFGPSNYISYSYELKDKTNRIKAKSEAVVYVIISYDNPVPSDKLVNGKYIENNDMGITLLNETNPNTFNNILFLIIMIFMMIGATLVFKYTKDKGLYIIVLSLLLVPITVFALEKLKLTFSTKITIDEKYNVFYMYSNPIKTSEIENNKSIYNCYDETYKISNTSDEYKWCNFLVKDSNSYKANDRVDVNKYTLYSINHNFCDNGANNIFNCTDEAIVVGLSEYQYMCGNKNNYMKFDEYLDFMNSNTVLARQNIQLSRENAPYYLNICTKDEYNNMNFNSILNQSAWYDDSDYGVIEFSSPNQFTMPRHDVYIDIYRPAFE